MRFVRKTFKGSRPVVSGLFCVVPLPPPGWQTVYSQGCSASLRLEKDGVVPEGHEATMYEYQDALSSRREIRFPPGTQLYLRRRGGQNMTAIVEAVIPE